VEDGEMRLVIVFCIWAVERLSAEIAAVDCKFLDVCWDKGRGWRCGGGGCGFGGVGHWGW
jgi:hypothetical protein